jgi:pyrroloquinoline quinone biosynthesis protein E
VTSTRDERLGLSPHAALKWRDDGYVLVAPERAIRLGGSGGEILELCRTGERVEAVVEILESRYPGEEGIAAEVERFLDEMRELGGIVRLEEGAEGITFDETLRPRDAPVGTLEPSEGAAPAPLNLIAEITYRCPLQCPYCSNPLDFRERREDLSAADWGRVFEEAADLGVVHVGLTGGEPSTRRDLEEILERAVAADLYPHLVTAGRPLDPERLDGLARRGLRSVQVSIQDATAEGSDRIAGTRSFVEKLAICERTVEQGMALTLNCVLHRENLDSVPALIELAERLQADRLELANTQYHGWALHNRAALMPMREQLERASRAVEQAQARHAETGGGPTMLFVRPDYFSERPKPCMGGWGRLAMVIDPTGQVLPCHDAVDLPGLEFWRVPGRPLADCWQVAPGMNAFRGTDWMPDPCRSCPDRERDFGGCRCQAFRLLGDASLTDPACRLSPHHSVVVSGRTPASRPQGWTPRR